MRGLGLLLMAGCGARTMLFADKDASIGEMRPDATSPCGSVVRGTLRMTADDQCRLFVNGALLDTKSDTWWNIRTVSVVLQVGRNSLAVEATNMWSQDGIDRGFIGELRFGDAVVSTGPTWKASKTLVSGWGTATFDTKDWHWAVNEGLDGIQPYGKLLGGSSWWLWTYDSNVPIAKKANVETVWLRYDFWIESNGAVSSTPLGCP